MYDVIIIIALFSRYPFTQWTMGRVVDWFRKSRNGLL